MAFNSFTKPSPFGQPQTSTFGGFGATVNPTAAPNTGFSFGTPAATPAASTFGFGSTPAPAFGTPAPAANAFSFNTGSSFGTPAATTSAFSFGAATTTTASSGFGFGNLGGTSAFGTGLTQPNLGAAQPSAFGTGLAQPTLGASQPSAFNFGATPAQNFGTGSSLFGAGTFNTGGLGAPFGSTVQQNNQPATNALTALASALQLPVLFGDERDNIIARWNQLQAFWGTGKGYYSLNAPPIEFTPENPFCRFKCIGYSRMPQYNAADGLVGLFVNKKDTELANQKQQIIESLHRLFGSKPTLAIYIEGIKGLSNNKAEVIIYVLERSAPNAIPRRIPTNDVINYLQQPSVKAQLSTLSIEQILPKVALSKEALQTYLETPPVSIDTILWQQAKLDNPDPEKFVPMPIIGFSGLNDRLKLQQQETKQHQERLYIISDDIAELKRLQTTTTAKILEEKRNVLEMGQRLLRVIVKQEVNRRAGFSLQPEEETVQSQLEVLQSELDSPTEYRGRLKELVSQIRIQNHKIAFKGENEKYKIGHDHYDEIKEHLKSHSDGINYLIGILREDLKALSFVEAVQKENLTVSKKITPTY